MMQLNEYPFLKTILLFILNLFQCFIQLVRPSDGETSDPIPFEYYPLEFERKRKSRRFDLNEMPPYSKCRFGTAEIDQI